MMPTHRTPDGRRVTVVDPSLPHQIRIEWRHGLTWVGCTCWCPPARSVDGEWDVWRLYNGLAHHQARGPFQPVDETTGRHLPAEAS